MLLTSGKINVEYDPMQIIWNKQIKCIKILKIVEKYPS